MSSRFRRSGFHRHPLKPVDSLSWRAMFNQSHRFYRYHHQLRQGLVGFEVRYRETDLWVRAFRILEDEAMEAVLNCRHQLQRYIEMHPAFLHSLVPLPDDPFAPPLVSQMMHAARATSVGPMASVAGAIAQAVSVSLKPLSPTIIVENGGDCYMDLEEEITVGIWAGEEFAFQLEDRSPLHGGPIPPVHLHVFGNDRPFIELRQGRRRDRRGQGRRLVGCGRHRLGKSCENPDRHPQSPGESLVHPRPGRRGHRRQGQNGGLGKRRTGGTVVIIPKLLDNPSLPPLAVIEGGGCR